MDIKERLKNAMRHQLTSTHCADRLEAMVDSFTKAALKALEEPTPPRNLLAVDEDTPRDTLCTVLGSRTVRPLKEIHGDWAERFVGIHLLPNPGYDKPPVNGPVIVEYQNNVEICHANYIDDWSKVHIKNWAPIKWVDGKLVIREEALR